MFCYQLTTGLIIGCHEAPERPIMKDDTWMGHSYAASYRLIPRASLMSINKHNGVKGFSEDILLGNFKLYDSSIVAEWEINT